MRIRKEKGISELNAARRASRYCLLAEYIYLRRRGLGIIEVLEDLDLVDFLDAT